MISSLCLVSSSSLALIYIIPVSYNFSPSLQCTFPWTFAKPLFIDGLCASILICFCPPIFSFTLQRGWWYHQISEILPRPYWKHILYVLKHSGHNLTPAHAPHIAWPDHPQVPVISSPMSATLAHSMPPRLSPASSALNTAWHPLRRPCYHPAVLEAPSAAPLILLMTSPT